MGDTRRPLRSGALARLTGVSSDTLRFYERRGLLPRPPRDTSGYRSYPAEAVDRVRMIQGALDAGFTLVDLTRILKQRDAGGVPCREVFTLASARFAELEERLAALTLLRDRLERVLDDWRRQLDATPANSRARLLERLSAHLSAPIPRSPRLLPRKLASAAGRQASIRRTVT
jgi:DNA-binding transcriptional MerR regulator